MAPSTKAQALLRELAIAERRVDELEAQLAVLRDAAPLPVFKTPRTTPSRVCEHKVAEDFILGHTKDGRAVWKCSKCSAEDTWESGWVYYGSLECRRCLRAAIEHVYCPTCAQGRGTAGELQP